MSKKSLPIEFRIKRIKTEEFAIIEEAFDENEPSIQYRVGTGLFAPENKTVICSISFSFAQKEIPYLKAEVSCAFEIREEAWEKVIDKEKNEAVFPVDFTDHLVVLTMGTLRGVLHAKTEGTPFNRFLIPTINITELRDNVKNLTIPLNYSKTQK